MRLENNSRVFHYFFFFHTIIEIVQSASVLFLKHVIFGKFAGSPSEVGRKPFFRALIYVSADCGRRAVYMQRSWMETKAWVFVLPGRSSLDTCMLPITVICVLSNATCKICKLNMHPVF